MFLDRVKVLDLSRLLPGGVASAMLTAMGALVVKVEEPSAGDYMRSMPPFGSRGNVYFEHLHRGQRSLAVDLRDARGREVLTALAIEADVILESFRPGVMARLGLGYDALTAANPRLIYCSLTAYGQPGEKSDADRSEAGHDLNIMALSGLLGYLTDGTGRVLPPPLPLADVAGGGMLAVTAILAALVERSRTGRGRRLDVAMLDGLRLLGVLQRVEGAASGHYPAHEELPLAGNLACYNVYLTADGGAMALGALEPKFWAAFCQ
ncbi:MAG: CaiB/BaiF CoA transferase family protein, partial [Bacillota bacterium]